MPEEGAITTRKRAIPWQTRAGTAYRVDTRCDGKSFPTTTRSQPIKPSGLQGSQITVSENHPAWRDRYIRSRADVGGEFSSTRQYVEVTPDAPVEMNMAMAFACPGTWAAFRESYTGDLLPTVPTNFPPFANSGDATIRAFGTKAIAAAKPTNPVVDLSVALGELLHEGIPKPSGVHTWEARTDTARSAGSEYLNIEFGWEPLRRDIQDFCKAILNSDRILAQYERDAGRLVRRRWEFEPLETNVVQSTINNASPWTNPGISLLDSSLANKGKVIVTRRTTIRRWFSGAFTYSMPLGSSSRALLGRDLQKAKKLLGISLTPDTIWNLTPWSWAIDWFTNTGDVISNLTDWATDCLVLKYGYIMEHSMNVDTYTFSGPTGFAGCSARPSTIKVTSETKKRLKATPYGFGITWSGLTPRQLAISAALGITRW